MATSRRSSSASPNRILGSLCQGPRAENLVVRDRYFIRHRLERPVALQLSNIDGEARLAIAAQPTAEVTDQPLQLDLGQLVPGLDVEPKGDRSQAGKKREAGKRPQRSGNAVAAGHLRSKPPTE